MKILPILICILIFNTKITNAYFETMSSADVTPQGQLRTTVAPQAVFSRHNGLTVNSLTDLGISESSNARLSLGLGSVDFSFAGFYKWAPIPDIDQQPAMALMIGSSYANIDGSNEFSLQIHPIISKSFETSIGKLTPHASIPVALMSRSGKTVFPLQLALGTSWYPQDFKWKQVHFISELNLNLNESFSSIVFGITYAFEQLPPLKVETLRN